MNRREPIYRKVMGRRRRQREMRQERFERRREDIERAENEIDLANFLDDVDGES